MTEVEQPPQNGIDLSANEDDDNSKARPADIEQDMREMERRKRVEAIMGSKLFREELERIVDSARDSGNADGILQQLSDIVGVPATRVGSVFKASNCMQPINDIRGVESMGYAKGEKILRCKLAATFRLLDLYGWTQGLGAQITARLKVDQEYFLVNPYGLLYHEITASSLNKVDMQGNIVEQGTTNFGVNKSHFVLHSVVHAARPDIRCAIYIGCSPVVAISSLKTGLLPLTKDACVLGDITTFSYAGSLYDQDERDKLVRNLGPNSKVMLLTNHGALCCGETIEEAFFAACHIVQACETQLKLLPVGLDNLVLISEESRKTIYEQSRRPPEDLAKKFAAANVNEEEDKKEAGAETTKVLGQPPKWRVGGAEFEALMRMLDNAGYRTGYIYRHPLIKTEPPKPKNDVELPPAVSSLGYLLEEEELFRQGIWKKGAMGKGGDRSRWLNSPNVYQKVEVLETGTPDPKKITKWVAEGSPTHSTPVRIDDPLQFVPVNTNPKEFKRLQQQIKENRRADKISAGPQSHILEGVTWDEANRIKDATVSQAGDHVVLMGAASKGIIQRGFQHNATVYKAPYAKNPFDNVTDDELNEYKRTVERKKKSIHGEYTDTDFSESEALSSLQTSGAQQQTKQNTTTTTTTAAVSQSEPEDISEHRVMRIETQQAPVPSQPEVVLSDATLSFINGERSHTATNRKPPTGRDEIFTKSIHKTQDQSYNQEPSIDLTANQSIALTSSPVENRKKNQDDDDRIAQNHMEKPFDDNFNYPSNVCLNNNKPQRVLVKELESDALFQKQKHKVHQHTLTPIQKERRPQLLLPSTTQRKTIHNIDLKDPIPTLFTYQSGNDNVFNSKPGPHIDLCSSKSPIKTSLYYNTSSHHPYLDWHYKNTRIKNSRKYGDQEKNLIYDYVDNAKYNLDENIATNQPIKRKYLISSKCYSPHICEEILDSLENPSNFQENYAGAQSTLDLIWNIPIRQYYSPCTTPEMGNTPTRNKSKRNRTPSKNPHTSGSNCDNERKSRTPYRTLSHFGFNSPQRNPQPDHKHILPGQPKRYIPLRRSVSYEEIFSSPRYIDLCEQCFEKIVRYKPELMQYRSGLRNLGEYQTKPRKGDSTNGEDMVSRIENENCLVEKLTDNNNDDENGESASNEPLSIFTVQLEPLIEVEERDSSDDRFHSALSSSIVNSSFIDKITRMNYSEISNVFLDNSTKTITATNIHLSLENVTKEGSISSNDSQDPSTIKEMANLKICNALEEENHIKDHQDELLDFNNNEDSELEDRFVSVIEILNFNDWLDDHTKANDDEINCAPPSLEENQVVTISSETQTEDQIMNSPSKGFSPCLDSSQNLPRSLMNRDERTRRKLEFQEIWEDHVRYCENREQVVAPNALSDTESAIDETQNETQRQEVVIQSNDNCHDANEEIFSGRSFLILPRDCNQKKNQNLKDSLDSDDTKSSSSKNTYNISEINSSQENLLCRSFGSTNILYNLNGQQQGNYEHTIPKEIQIDNEVASIDMTLCVSGGTNRPIDYNHDEEGSENKLNNHTNQRKSQIIEIREIRVIENPPLIPKVPKTNEINQDDDLPLAQPLIRYKSIILNNSDDGNDFIAPTEGTATPESITDDNDENLFDTNDILKRIDSLQSKDKKNYKFTEDNNQPKNSKSIEKNQDSNLENIPIALDHIRNFNLNNSSSDCNKENESEEQLSSLEKEILEKIEIHQLNKTEEIFNKIEKSIRNKITPNKLEMLIKEQWLCLYGEEKTMPALSPSTSSPSQTISRRSRSLTPYNENSCSPSRKLNRTTTPPVGGGGGVYKKKPTSSPRQLLTPSPPVGSQTSTGNKARNFILENIRNAAIPRGTPQIKRLQGSAQAIFGRNPFGPRPSTSTTNSLNNLKKSSKAILKSPNKTNLTKSLSSPTCSTNVYTFQSKLVRGSPRFWVSMAHSPERNRLSTSLPSRLVTQSHNKKSNKKFTKDRSNMNGEEVANLDSDLNVDTTSSSMEKLPTRVDEEINALGQEIQQIQPRLENYKRKLDDFGDRVAKCARHMDECIASHDEIINEQSELKKDMTLQQYVDDITCRVQTFSLSETED